MLLLLSVLGNVLQSYMYIYRESYVTELLISFLPYAIGINFLLILFTIYKSIHHYIKKNTFLTLSWFVISILSIGFLTSYISRYTNTYTNIIPYNNQEKTLTSSEGLSFLYANIYHKNEKFSELISTIEEQKPDIVLLVEYAKIHDEVLAPLLKQEYSYVSRYVGGEGYDGDVIYSRFPLKKIKHTIYPGSFSHVSIEYNNKSIDFALIHTSAPVSPYFFTMRNKQLSDLSNLMTEYYIKNQKKEIILLGDFNISPRSFYYKKFEREMNTIGLYNNSNNMLYTDYNTIFPYTRCHKQASYICSHIDHVRSNKSNIGLKKITIPGSDHDGFIGKI